MKYEKYFHESTSESSILERVEVSDLNYANQVIDWIESRDPILINYFKKNCMDLPCSYSVLKVIYFEFIRLNTDFLDNLTLKQIRDRLEKYPDKNDFVSIAVRQLNEVGMIQVLKWKGAGKTARQLYQMTVPKELIGRFELADCNLAVIKDDLEDHLNCINCNINKTDKVIPKITDKINYLFNTVTTANEQLKQLAWSVEQIEVRLSKMDKSSQKVQNDLKDSDSNLSDLKQRIIQSNW